MGSRSPSYGDHAGTSLVVRAPASSANLGPGFDSVGLALGVWDSYVVTLEAEPGLRVSVTGEGAGQVPTDERHLVYRSMLRAFDAEGVRAPGGLRLDCHNAVPQGRGLGSSATAIVAGVAAAYALVALVREGEPHADLDAVNDLASSIEGHPDNASASVFGGMTLSVLDDATGRVRTVCLPVHPDVVPVVLVPATTLATSTARAVLPSHVPHAEAALNSGRAALLVHAMTCDPSLLLPATREWLHQEQRRASFPASMALVDRLRAGGHAAVISGAGPSVLVLATRRTEDEVVSRAASPGWKVTRPGMTDHGVTVDRVTLSSHPAETAGHQGS